MGATLRIYATHAEGPMDDQPVAAIRVDTPGAMIFVDAPTCEVTVDYPHGRPYPPDWHSGYQTALRDLAVKLDQEGPRGAAQWIKDNTDGQPGHVLRHDADLLLDSTSRWAERPWTTR